MGTAVRTATTSPASWDAFADVDAFVDEVLTELAADLPPVWRFSRTLCGSQRRLLVFGNVGAGSAAI
jgi:hypothetical protein